MVKQYPHILKVTTPGETTRNAQGYPVSSPVTENEYECRAEANIRNAFVQGQDGSRIDYSWKVYMPVTSDIIQLGSKVELSGVIGTITDTVKFFEPGQLNAKVYL